VSVERTKVSYVANTRQRTKGWRYLKAMNDFVIFNISQWNKYAEMNFLQNGAPSHFGLTVRASHDMYFPSSWNARRGLKRNDLYVLHFDGSGQKRNSTDQNQECLMKWNKKFQIHLQKFLLTSAEKVSVSC
jgi:hypothetical protein